MRLATVAMMITCPLVEKPFHAAINQKAMMNADVTFASATLLTSFDVGRWESTSNPAATISNNTATAMIASWLRGAAIRRPPRKMVRTSKASARTASKIASMTSAAVSGFRRPVFPQTPAS